MSLRDELLPVVDELRGLPGEFGFRRFTVTIRRRTWSGGQPGSGTATNTDLVIAPAPRVRQIGAKEVASSGGTFETGDYRCTKITPAFTGPPAGGHTPAQLHPQDLTAAQDLVVVLVADDGTKLCTIVAAHFDEALGYELVVRPRRETP